MVLSLLLVAAAGVSVPDMPRGYSCEVASERHQLDDLPGRVTGTYPHSADPENLTTMMRVFHTLLSDGYPHIDGADIRVLCTYRDHQGKGLKSIIYFVDDNGPYGERIP